MCIYFDMASFEGTILLSMLSYNPDSLKHTKTMKNEKVFAVIRK